jgi:hypothetical protein
MTTTPSVDAVDDVAGEAAPAARAQAHYRVPNLVFDNRTGFAASQFDSIDQYGNAAHVVVARTAYAIGPRDAGGVAELTALAMPAALLAEDVHVADDPAASVLQESDFAPYKPRCDIIVNAVAHAPGGTPTQAFRVNLSVYRPPQADASGAGPTAHMRSGMLLDKTLRVLGEHHFKRKRTLWRVLQWTVRIASLGLVRPLAWRLTPPGKFVQLPMRYEFALGGDCRIAAADPAAARVPKKARLPHSAKAQPDAAIAHESCQTNPVGSGFARRWYLDAKRIQQLPAPRITYPEQPCTARQFWRAVQGEDLPGPAGLGSIGRGWLPRRALAGHFVEKAEWGADEVPGLPADFDFAYWNSAPLDQQCEHLAGGERVALTNLCRADHPSAYPDKKGHTMLRFNLPQQSLFFLLADQDSKVAVLRLLVDTVVIDPEASRVDLVWRVHLPADGVFHTARLMHVAEPAQLARLRLVEQLQERAGAAAGAAPP